MKRNLLIVHLEDDPKDSDMVRALLEEGGIAAEIVRVDSESGFRSALGKKELDLIISDVNLPSFDGLTGLKIARVEAPDVPFLFVSGTIGEDMAVESLRGGATDYILKQNMSRFVTAVRRALDDSEGKRLHRRAEEQVRKLSTAVEQTADTVVITNKDGFIEYVNPAFERLTGYSREEVLGKTPRILKSGKQDLAFYQGLWKRVLEGASFRDIFVNRKKNGELYYTQQTITPLVDEHGNITHFVSSGRDVTDQRRAEEALIESERRYREVVENAAEIIFSTDERGNFLSANPAALKSSGYSLDELKRHNYLDLIQPEYRTKVLTTYQRQFLRRDPVSYMEYPFRMRSGETRWLAQNASLRTHAGEVTGFDVIARDITELKKAELALASSESELRALFAAMTDVVLVLDSDGRYLQIAPTNPSNLYRPPAELRGKTIHEVLPKVDADTILHHIRQALQTNQPVSVEYSLVIGDAEIWFDGNVSPFGRDKVLWIARDVTARKNAEREVESVHAQLKTLFDNLPEAVFSVDLLRNRMLQASPAHETIFGFPPSEFFKNTRLWYDIILPEDRPVVDAGYPLLAAGKSIWHEYRIRRPDGRIRWIEASVIPTLDSNGNLARIDGIASDITDRKDAQEALELQRSYFEQLFADSPYGIALMDGAEHVLNVNKAFERMFQYTLGEINGRTLSDLVVPTESRGEARNTTEQTLRGELVQTESVRQRKDSLPVDVAITAYPITIKEKIVGMYQVFVDISGRKRLELQLRQAQKLEGIGTLAGGIAHDFNNILGIILTYISVLDKLAANPAKFTGGVEAITKAVERGASLVRQLLTFARQTQVKLEPVAVNDIILELMKMLRATFPRTIELKPGLLKDIPSVVADASQLHQVILNLCVNARDAMPDGGKLSMRTAVIERAALRARFPEASEEMYVHVGVSDTGTGISQDTIDRIFDPFFTTKEAGKGTGLGLAVVYGVVKSHGGFIDVKSELGKGTTFNIYLPVRASTELGPQKTRKGIEEAPGGTETVLVVEDEESLLSMVQSILESKGYKVLTALDGEEAVEVYRNRHAEIDIVLTDMGLPRLSGWQAVLRMKRIKAGVRAIFASGFLEPGMKESMEREGFVHFVQKPYTLGEVLNTIRKVLNKKR